MKIVIFSPYFYPRKGGLEQFSWELSTRMAKLGHDIIVVASKTGQEKQIEYVEGIKVVRLDTYDLLGNTFPIQKTSQANKVLLNNIFLEKIDLVITNTRFFPLTLIGLRLAKKHNVRSILVEHGTCHPKLSSPAKNFIGWFYDQTLGRFAFKLAGSSLAISKSSALFAQTLGGKNVEIVYNSVDTDYFKPIKKKSSCKGVVHLIYVGRLIKAKGVQDLIAAFKMIESDKIKLSVVGTGNYEKQLLNLAGKDTRIKFLGQKDKRQIRDLLSQSDIFINPSYSEGLPTSVLEAGAMGLAIIATNAGGTAEIIKNKFNGFLIQPACPSEIYEKLTFILKNQQEMADLGKNVRKTISLNFDWDKNLPKFVNYFKKEI